MDKKECLIDPEQELLAEQGDEYHEMQWQEEAFIEQVGNIMSLNTTLDYVHKIKLKDKSSFYLVPEAFYLKAKRRHRQLNIAKNKNY